MQELELLNNKLDLLLKRYTGLLAENKSLKGTIAKQQRSLEMLNAKLDGLEQNMMVSQISNTVADPKEKDALRKQLDTVIGQIDKILVTLND
jgi:hypothetical protein